MRFVCCAFLALCLCAIFDASAQSKLYRWVDDEGNVHYTDKIPAEYADQARKKLNQQGIVVNSVEAAPSPEQIEAARAKAEAAAGARRENEEQQRLDLILLNSYEDVAAMERAREEEIRALQRNVDMNLTVIDRRRQHLHDLVGRAAVDQRAGRPVPDSLTGAIAQTRREMEELNIYIEDKRAEQAQVFAQYEQRIKRYKELKAEG